MAKMVAFIWQNSSFFVQLYCDSDIFFSCFLFFCMDLRYWHLLGVDMDNLYAINKHTHAIYTGESWKVKTKMNILTAIWCLIWSGVSMGLPLPSLRLIRTSSRSSISFLSPVFHCRTLSSIIGLWYFLITLSASFTNFSWPSRSSPTKKGM